MMRLALAVALIAGSPAAARERPVIAMTFDDLPVHGALPVGETRLSVAMRIIAALRSADIAAVSGFLNARAAEQDPALMGVLEAWRRAGFTLGNHGWSHLNLDAIGVPAFEEQIARNEPLLDRMMGKRDWRWFRYPFLAEGSDAARRDTIRGYLSVRGYRIAAVTMSFGDFLFNDPYARCVAVGDVAAIRRMRKAYLDEAARSVRATRAAAMARYGRDIPYILLMHIGAFDARMLPRLIRLYRRSGFRFVDLPTAEADPAYARYVDPANRGVPSPLDLPRGSDLNWLNTICR